MMKCETRCVPALVSQSSRSHDISRVDNLMGTTGLPASSRCVEARLHAGRSQWEGLSYTNRRGTCCQVRPGQGSSLSHKHFWQFVPAVIADNLAWSAPRLVVAAFETHHRCRFAFLSPSTHLRVFMAPVSKNRGSTRVRML